MGTVHTENRAGKPIQVGDAQITPIEKTTRWQPPGMWGVLLWRRPSAVIIKHSDGSEEELPIQDHTRQAQFLLLSTGLLAAILVWIISQIRK